MAPVRSRREPSIAVTLAAAAVLVFATGWIDYLTGVEFRVFPLYFVPVLGVALRLGRWPGLGAAFASAGTWLVSNQLAGMSTGTPVVAAVNAVVMAVAFGAVALLGAAQRTSLHRERALSRTDGLTGILNGRGFYEAAATELARASRYRHPLTLAYVDLDDFKAINDRYGHARGDAVLVAVARSLKRACRASDLVGRMGGDEFVILFPETSREAAEAAIGKLRSRVEELSRQEGWPLSASIGSVTFAIPPADVETLVHEADTAMYAAKAAGRNGLHCLSHSENQ